MIGVYLLNVSGLRPVVNVNLVIAVALLVLSGVCVIGPIAAGQLHHSLSFNAGHGAWKIIVTLFTWGFVASWTAYGTELPVSFMPEYRDAARAMRAGCTSSTRAVSRSAG